MNYAGVRPLWQRYLSVLLYLLGSFALIQVIAVAAAPFTQAGSAESGLPFRVLLSGVVIQMMGFLLPAPLLLRFTRAGSFAFSRTQAGEILLACGLIFGSLIVFSVIYNWLGINPKQLAFLDAKEIYRHRNAFLFITAVVVPAYEEWIFRGLLFGVLVTAAENSRQVLTASLFCGLLFTASHFEGRHSLSALPPIFVMAMIFQYVTWRSQSLWPAVCGHAMQNLLSAAAMVAKTGADLSR